MNQCKVLFFLGVFIFSGILLVSSEGMAGTPAPGEVFSCADDSDVNKTISAQAALENFSCVVKRWDSADTLHFNVAVKNISSEDQRFKVNIFLSNGKAVGGLLPRKTKNGLVKPGETIKFAYPVKGVAGAPGGKIDLFIKTMAK